MDKILDILNGWLTTAVSSGTLDVKQVLLFIFVAGPLVLIAWKIRGIISFVNEIKNSRINELQRLLDSHDLPNEISTCINDEIKRIIGYRISGISDIARQEILWRVFAENRNLIPVDFFKKFRTFLVIEGNILHFNKGLFYWIENGIYGLFSFQFLFLAILFIMLSIYRSEFIPYWGHLMLYFVALIMLLFFIIFVQMIPRKKECKLLNEILLTQHRAGP